MDPTFVLPGTDGPVITLRRSWSGSPWFYVGGDPLERRGLGGEFVVRLADGRLRTFKVSGSMFNLTVRLDDGTVVQVEPRLAWWEVLLAALPLGLVIAGGLTGAAAGYFATIANLRIMHSSRPLLRRIGLVLGVLAVSTVGVLAVTTLIHSIRIV